MPPPSLVADRFVLERPAGSGGMGTVYRALDRQSGAVVALKLLASDAPSLRARALVEADALAALDHPAIVRLIAHGLADDGRPFLAMEWLEGEDLAARLARGPLTALEAVRLGARVAAALAAAHARGVLHRDLKPSNLFLPGGDVTHVKLVDFGIARLAQARQRLTAPGAYLGTPGYMAPEQVSGDGEFGPAVDLFALGAVLFECLAGRPAFGGASPVARLAKVLLDEPPRLDALRADLSLALTDLVTGLLAKDPACRPTAAEAATALAFLRSAVEPALPSAGAPTLAVEGLSGAEQRLVCVLLARILPDEGAKDGAGANEGAEDGSGADEKAGGLPALETTLPADAAPRPVAAERNALARLRTLVASLGGRAHELMEGALVAAWLGPGVPRDQAALAARAALLARERLPGVALALASGLTETVRPVPLGVAFDRAAAMLDARAGPSDAVPLDHVTAGLLDARFALRESAAGPELCGLRAPEEEEARLLLGRSVPCVGR
ncbi:MAG TPA: serine/threonine-protein kinase, partial [Polyangiaceae bacterium]|nr:serine/threonine-protein kinase [Polyangiaceae bacterium]